ncbi:MAG: hypothetical protein MUF24_00390 [Chitinophagaceae bacterium]|jgi:hypothetical protein|nr:hypothetical protein [Chitinophagaceae bacterium]
MKYFISLLSIFALLLFYEGDVLAQKHEDGIRYWNSNTQLIPWRPMPPIKPETIQYVDLDNDGDPDLLRYTLENGMTVIWIDDDDDMKMGDLEGDTDSDCLLIDRNRDGIFGGPRDMALDWGDEDGDGRADIQLLVSNGGLKNRNFYDWDADFMYLLDEDGDNIMHYIDWNLISMQAWEHNGHANFYEDYHGNTLFLKMHGSSFRIEDLRLNWENPFIFYDVDSDGLTETAVRFVNTPTFRPVDNKDSQFNALDTAIDIKFNGKMDYASVAWDLDNDNGQGNEFDFDLTLLFRGEGFDYTDQVQKFKSLQGLGKQTAHLLYDNRWRELNELLYPGRDTAFHMIYTRGKWDKCWLVFDEDDDCNRWERVELYEPRDLWNFGRENGGLDHNGQADDAGDRGEFDTDFSGRGQLYIGGFDGKIHLYGAEWGAWRIDQTAYSFQGFGGLYNRWRPGRLQKNQDVFATVKYDDTNGNGFFDKIAYDLDGDKVFEDSVSLLQLGIDDRRPLLQSSDLKPDKPSELFTKLAEANWQQALIIEKQAQRMGLNTTWYAVYKQPRTLHEKYDFAYWLGFYLYHDMRDNLRNSGHEIRIKALDKAYYSGNWSGF